MDNQTLTDPLVEVVNDLPKYFDDQPKYLDRGKCLVGCPSLVLLSFRSYNLCHLLGLVDK